MTTRPQVNGNIYRDALRRGRANTQAVRDALRKMLEESPGPQTVAMLVTKIAVAAGNIEAVLTELDLIGRNEFKGDADGRKQK